MQQRAVSGNQTYHHCSKVKQPLYMVHVHGPLTEVYGAPIKCFYYEQIIKKKKKKTPESFPRLDLRQHILASCLVLRHYIMLVSEVQYFNPFYSVFSNQ